MVALPLNNHSYRILIGCSCTPPTALGSRHEFFGDSVGDTPLSFGGTDHPCPFYIPILPWGYIHNATYTWK